jgi:hypothetical protein
MPPATVAGDPHWAVLLDDAPDPAGKNSPLEPSFFPARFYQGIRCRSCCLQGIPSGCSVYTRGEREDSSTGVFWPSHGGAGKFARRQGRFAPLRRWPAASLDPQILPASWESRPEDTKSDWRKGGEIRVKYFKISKTWVVKAEFEAEAIKLIAADPENYLDAETVTRTEYKKRQPDTGWGSAVKDQLLGSNSKR